MGPAPPPARRLARALLYWKPFPRANRLERWWLMSRRDSNLLWLKDLLEHLCATRQQLEWADEAETVQVLTEAMIRDLNCCRRLCATLSQGARPAHAV